MMWVKLEYCVMGVQLEYCMACIKLECCMMWVRVIYCCFAGHQAPHGITKLLSVSCLASHAMHVERMLGPGFAMKDYVATLITSASQ